MDPGSLLALIGGLAALTIGAELMVRGAGGIAAAAGMPPLVIGLTLVAYGTSAPELAVSGLAAGRGDAETAIGNVIGSNLFNVLVILGLGGLMRPMVASSRLVRREVPLLIAASALAWVMAADGSLGRFDGAVLLTAFVAFTGFTLWSGKREAAQHALAAPAPGLGGAPRSAALNVGTALAGLALLVIGARWFIDGARDMGLAAGLSPKFVGFVIIAAGTSLPELATTVLASLRNQGDVAVGNVIGSNLFNLLAVLGTAAVVAPGGVPVPEATLHVELPVLVASAALCLPVFLSGRRISRSEGLLFLGLYAGYCAWSLARDAAPPG